MVYKYPCWYFHPSSPSSCLIWLINSQPLRSRTPLCLMKWVPDTYQRISSSLLLEICPLAQLASASGCYHTVQLPGGCQFESDRGSSLFNFSLALVWAHFLVLNFFQKVDFEGSEISSAFWSLSSFCLFTKLLFLLRRRTESYLDSLLPKTVRTYRGHKACER